MDGDVWKRNSGQIDLSNNVVNVDLSWFKNVDNGDLTLTSSHSVVCVLFIYFLFTKFKIYSLYLFM